MTNKPKIIRGQQVKLKNRRVDLWQADDGSWIVLFKRIGTSEERQAGSRVVNTHVHLSDEALTALAWLISVLKGPSA